jgi:hypothetical protein
MEIILHIYTTAISFQIWGILFLKDVGLAYSVKLSSANYIQENP